MHRIASFLQIRAGEARMVALVAALFALVELGRGIGGNAADGLFFVRFGVANLPYMYLILGAVTFGVMLAYTAALGRFDKRALFAQLFLLCAILLALERAALALNFNFLYPLLWLTINAISVILGTLVWSVATETCDTRQAKRLFSLFTALGILGGVVGNFLTGPLAQLIGTENLVLLYAALLVASLALTRATATRFFKPAAPAVASTNLVAEIRVGLDFVRASPLLQFIAYASVLFSILFFSISFPFNKAVSAAYPNEADVAGFLGTFSAANTIVTFFVSLFIANRLYNRIGIVNAVLILPLTYLAGFILFAAHFSLFTAILARSAQMLVMGGIAGSAWSTFFNVVPPEKRAQVQSFDSGVTAQIGIAVSGALLLLGDRVFSTTPVFMIGMVATLVTGYLVYRMKSAYGDALVAALRAGYVDVFTATRRGFQHLGADASALETALAGLHDAKPSVRRVSAEILSRLRNPRAIEPLTRALADSDHDVRYAALAALVQLDARDAADAIAARLRDDAASVRAAAIDALARLAPQSSAVANSLADPDPHVRAHAAVALHRAGTRERAEHTIRDLLNSNRTAFRIAGLGALAESGVVMEFERVGELTRADAWNVRVAAVSALRSWAVETASTQSEADLHRLRTDAGQFGNQLPRLESPATLLLHSLDDPDTRVRRASARALQSFDGAVGEIIAVLNSNSARAQDAALVALEGRGVSAQKAITDWALAQIPRAKQYRDWASALGTDDCATVRAIAYLRDLLHQCARKTEARVLHALALVGKKETIDLIGKGLSVKSQETRAQAIEALDTLGDKRIARELIPLLEDISAAPGDARATLTILTAHPDAYLRALAVHAIGELLSRDLQTLVSRARADNALLVREAAGEWTVLAGTASEPDGSPDVFRHTSLATRPVSKGGTMPETLQTLSTMDRILFLRQVPIFSNLAPEDLDSIAGIATERAWTRGEFICREGEIGDELFVIVEGAVRIAKKANGELRTLRTLQAGEQIGELAILREQPRSASVIAEAGDVRALVIRGDALKAILRDRPEVAMAMLASLAQRLSTN